MVYDIILILFIAVFAFIGKKRGLIGSVLNFASAIVAYIVSAIFSPPLTEAFSKTQMYADFAEKTGERLLENADSKIPFISGLLQGGGINVAESATDFFVQAAISVLLFVATLIILKILSKVLSAVFRLPGLNLLNSAGGLILGLGEGFIIAYVILAVWGLCTALETPALVGGTTLLKSMFENNLLFIFFA